MQQPLTIQNLRELIHQGEAKDPLVFLESVMSGNDPRQLSDIYELIEEIDSFTGGDISQGDWSDIVDLVSTFYKYRTVSLSDSIGASKTLAEYLHAKRKQIDINTDSSSSGILANNLLTEEEIEIFKEKFNDDF